MKTGIVLLNYNTENDIKRLVEEIIKSEFDKYIVVADNSENREKKDELKSYIEKLENKNISYIENSGNIGYYKGNLQGVKFLKRVGLQRCLILNPDTGCTDWNGVVNSLNKKMDEDKSVFICGPKVKIPDYDDVSTPKVEFTPFKEIIYNICFPLSYFLGRKKIKRKSEKSGYVFSVEGSAYIVDIDKFIEIEDYFKNIFLYGEEIIFGLAAENKKWKIWFEESCEILHYHPPRQESKTYDKFYMKSLQEILNIFYKNKLINKMVILSVKYKNSIKKVILKLRGAK